MLPSCRPFGVGLVRPTKVQGCFAVGCGNVFRLSVRPSVPPSNGPLSFGHGNCLKVFAYLLKINRSLHVVIGSASTWEGEGRPTLEEM